RDGPTDGTPGLAGRVTTEEIDCPPSGRDPHIIGVVVVHGGHTFDSPTTLDKKRVSPTGRSTTRLVQVLARAGFKVSTPEMPWSIAHTYDRSFDEALDEIATAVADLRAHGAVRVVIVGHSFGGGAVIGFGALRRGIDGVAALA